MKSVEKLVKSAQKTVQKTVNRSVRRTDSSLTKVLANPYVYGLVVVLLAMYGPRLAPKLPTQVRKLFDSVYFRGAVMALVVYLTAKNLQLALIVAVGFILVLHIFNSLEIKERFAQTIGERFDDHEGECDPATEDCL